MNRTDPVLPGPHRRYNPLTGEWLLVSAGRTDRPWQGAVGPASPDSRPRFDPECYLCPGNTRANGARNPVYDSTFVFTNDFAALRPDTTDVRLSEGLLLAEGEQGTCRVVCFSPRHDLTLAGMTDGDVRRVVDLWADQTAELGERYRWVQVFENRGEMMGASNPHPHGQIWAGTALPVEPAKEDARQRDHLERHGRPLLEDYADQEEGGARVVISTPEWLVVVPFWAAWPFETIVVPRVPVPRLPELGDRQRSGLVEVLRRLLDKYDGLFAAPFPYSMGWHGAPYGDAPVDHWVVHAHFYPPLLRSATVRKYMVGYELLSETQRDITPEEAAARLAAVPDRLDA